MSDALASTIARVSATTRCRYCGDVVAPDAILCPCRIERGELPHTEWGAETKRFLCVRKVERVREQFTSEHPFWERLALDLYRGTWRGDGPGRVLLPMSASIVDVFPHVAGDAAAWIAAGRPVTFTL